MPSQVEWARRQYYGLLAALRPNAVALVDAFGFSDYALHSALGRADGDVYCALLAAAQARAGHTLRHERCTALIAAACAPGGLAERCCVLESSEHAQGGTSAGHVMRLFRHPCRDGR